MIVQKMEPKDHSYRVSVSLCTYNGARFLREQLDSIAQQTLLPFELVICDDGSIDDTIDIIEQFCLTAPFEVRLVRNEKNLGVSKNFENAINLCNGQFIALSDQDDVWCPQRIEYQTNILIRDPALDGVFSDAWLIDERSNALNRRLWPQIGFAGDVRQGVHIERELMKVLLKRDVVTGATLMIRSASREFLLPIPENWIHDAWIAWNLVACSGVAATGEPLINYRIHATQQVGVGPESNLKRIPESFQRGRNYYALQIQRFQYLFDHWSALTRDLHPDAARALQGKIKHLTTRANLPERLLPRACKVLSTSPGYFKYSLGIQSMCKDLLIRD